MAVIPLGGIYVMRVPLLGLARFALGPRGPTRRALHKGNIRSHCGAVQIVYHLPRVSEKDK